MNNDSKNQQNLDIPEGNLKNGGEEKETKRVIKDSYKMLFLSPQNPRP